MNPIRPILPRQTQAGPSNRTKSKAMRRATANATAMMIMASQAYYMGGTPRSGKKTHTSSPPKPYLSFRKRSQLAKSDVLTKSLQMMVRVHAKRSRK